jgi:hypothetical protein
MKTNKSEMEASYETYTIFVYSEKLDACTHGLLTTVVDGVILMYMWIRVTVIYL